ncbi:ARM repeat-containing protein [Flagelloscypha sp. PMI_526]|nr:ARM repeat-containing protein [Flagelloscypha sp. PMI_526]
MEHTQRVVTTWMATDSAENITELVSDIVAKRTTWLTFIKALGEYLTSEQEEPRKKGVQILSLVLEECPPEKLNRQSIHVLIEFMCSKLDDYATLVLALKGLLPLVSASACQSEDAVKVAHKLFEHVQMKFLIQGERLVAWKIMDRLLANHREALKALGSEFVGSYATWAEGEKDPRNLTIAFALARVVLIEFDPQKKTDIPQSLFNITFCYFPITYRPPPNDPYNISTASLQTSLRAVLSALPEFGPLAMPVFLEKLLAGGPVAKRDVLETMSICLPVYGAALSRSWGKKIWGTVKLEIFQPTDPQTETLALLTTQVLIRTIYSQNDEEAMDQDGDQATTKTEMEGLARDACEECITILKEPEKSQAKPAMKVLCAFISSTPTVSKFTTSQTISHLLKLFAKPEEAPTRGSTLSLLVEFLTALSSSSPSSSEQLSEYKDELLGCLTTGLKIPNARVAALKGLKVLIGPGLSGLLTNEEIGFVVHCCNEVMQEGSGDEDVDDEYRDDLLSLLTTLSSISTSTCNHIETQILPPLFTSLPSPPLTPQTPAERYKTWKTLDTLKTICASSSILFEPFVIRLIAKLEVIQVAAGGEVEAAYAHSILKTLFKGFVARGATVGSERGAEMEKYVQKFVPRLLGLFLKASMLPTATSGESDDGGYQPFCDPRLIVVGAEIVECIVRTLSVARQQIFIASLFEAFLEGKPERVVEKECVVGDGFSPFATGSTSAQRNTVLLFTASIVPLRREVPLPVPNLSSYASTLLDWGMGQADSSIQRESAWKILGAISNKYSDDLAPFLEEFKSTFYTTHLSNPSSSPNGESALSIFAWITKSLLIRSHSLSTELVEKLFILLDSSSSKEFRWEAGKVFGFLANKDGETTLTKENGCVVKGLWAQRFVVSVLGRIVKGAKTGNKEDGTQVTYLVALTSLITSTPRSVYVGEIGSLMPLLLLSLSLPDPIIRSNVIETLTSAIKSEEGQEPGAGGGVIKKIISEHASSLVNTMLKNARLTTEEGSHPDVRMASLKLLGCLPDVIEYPVLHPLRGNVIRQLGNSLDDPKRNVRKEAVDARTKWFEMNG